MSHPKTVGELKEFLKDIPNDTILVEHTADIHCVMHEYLGPCIYYPDYPGKADEESTNRFEGKNLLILG